MLLRYLLLAAFLPSAFLIYSYVFLKNARLLQLVSAIAMILGAFHFSDHLRYLQMLRAENRLDVNGALAQFLSDHRVRYAIAPYWRAYDITFRTQGKIIVASSQLVRIPAYQELYQLHANGAPEKDSQSVARIDDRNCQDGTLEWVAQIPVCLVSARPTPGHQVGN